jgi:co-chaperonin GroES (HSP10)
MSVTKRKEKLLNKSGIYPAGNRVLIFPDPIESTITSESIHLPEYVREKYASAQASGTVIALGPDAFRHITERRYHVHGDTRRELFEETVRGYSEDFARPGDRISFAKYAGQKYRGSDGKRYLVVNDEDITTKLDEDVELTDLDTRHGAGL